METSPYGRAFFGAFGVLVLAVAVRVVRRSPWMTWVGVVLALLIVEAAFYFYATGSLIAYMLQDWVATTDELFAAGATFTLLAWAFAYVYVVCQVMVPGSFGPADHARTWVELLFLSVAVLSSVGLSDILPTTPMARSLVMLESFAGIMYIALVVSRLISLTAVARRDRT